MIIAMRISTFFYTIKQGLKNIWKNKMFSLASIATMTACIFLFGLFYTIVTNFQSMVKDAESGVAVTVFFDEGISQDKIDEIGDLIRARAEVSDLEFVSADDAWDSFKQTYFEGNEAAAESFAGDNPLANDASYSIYMNDISMQQTLVTYLQSVDGIREVKQSAVVANTLTDFNKLIGYVSAGIIIILLGVAVFLISNTHRWYFCAKRRDWYYETDRCYRLFCACTICGRRYCDRIDRSSDSAWHPVCPLWTDH